MKSQYQDMIQDIIEVYMYLGEDYRFENFDAHQLMEYAIQIVLGTELLQE